jgi:hypothetical protein
MQLALGHELLFSINTPEKKLRILLNELKK